MAKKKANNTGSADSIPQFSELETSPANSGKFSIVGIGASAGGLAAFEAFFSGMSDIPELSGTNSEGLGMAFVLVQHLAPDHKSLLSELVSKYTKMPVFEVKDGMNVKPDSVYIIPPGSYMAFINGTLQLLDPPVNSPRLPVDFLFRSLALDQKERAIGIVLSGTGSDGTLGVRAVKGAGGLVMAQNPESTEYDGMPRSAIATGMVDYELIPSEMPSHLVAYLTHPYVKKKKQTYLTETGIGNALKKLFILLRSRTGHDFSLYKTNTILRRIERRMAVNKCETIDKYIFYAQHTPSEIDMLFRDLLIGVTSFFRDTPAFKVIEEKVIPHLFESIFPDNSIRIWVPGCSTGEEAYSLAILLSEHMESLKKHIEVQIFATDIDSNAITAARKGLYPSNITADISPERLNRFFTTEPGGDSYLIRKNIRDMLIFSEQDIVQDPPFSKLNLISCRNLLIYMNSELQKKLIPLFHYSLKAGGFLFLGTSETIGEYETLFKAYENKQKVYIKKDHIRGNSFHALNRILPPKTSSSSPEEKVKFSRKLSMRELVEQTLLKKAPAAVLVNRSGDILYLHNRTGLFLEPAPGIPGLANIIKMARQGLRSELTTALHKAAKNMEEICCRGLRVKTNGDYSTVDLTVYPVDVNDKDVTEEVLYIVILELTNSVEYEIVKEPPVDRDEELSKIEALNRELMANHEYLKASQEELETANEELKSSNEELQSVNEEMQSTNEELETSKEELQSVNEELSTVNAELQSKINDLKQSNDDMNNLLAGTGIGTLFVDYNLNILRFTPMTTKIINLIQNDIGRPVSHILSNIKNYNNLITDIQEVLDSLINKEIEVKTTTGVWYTMRIQPYRTTDNIIEGVVITFVDISKAKKTAEDLKNYESSYHNLYSSTSEMIQVIELIYDSKGRAADYYFRDVNPSFENFAGKTKEQLINKRAAEIFTKKEENSLREYDKVFRTGDSVSFENYSKENGRYYKINAWKTYYNQIAVSFKDITDKKQIEVDLERTRNLLRQTEKIGKIGGWQLDGQTLKQSWTEETFRMLEIDTADRDLNTLSVLDYITEPYRKQAEKAIKRAFKNGVPFDQEWEMMSSKGNIRLVRAIADVIKDKYSVKFVFGSLQDISGEKQGGKK